MSGSYRTWPTIPAETAMDIAASYADLEVGWLEMPDGTKVLVDEHSEPIVSLSIFGKMKVYRAEIGTVFKAFKGDGPWLIELSSFLQMRRRDCTHTESSSSASSSSAGS